MLPTLLRRTRTFARVATPGALAFATLSCLGDLFGPAPAIAVRLEPVDGRRVVGIGQTLKINARGWAASGYDTEAGRLTWSVSDSSLASVSSRGLVTGLAIGTVTITGATKNASDSVEIRVRSAICARSTVTGTLILGVPTGGALDLTDCALTSGPLADGWELEVAAPTTVAIIATSTDLDATSVVTDLAMRSLPIHDYDYGRSTPAKQRVHSLLAGTYIVWATSAGAVEEGSYELAIRSVTPCSLGSAVSGVLLDAVRIGSLLPADCLLSDGRPADGQVVTIGAKSVIGVETKSADFPPASVMTTAAMKWVPSSYEFSQESTRSRQLLTLAPGTFVLWGTSAGDLLENGAYSLRTRTMPTCSPANTSRTIAVGETILDSLTLDDCVIVTAFTRLGEVRALTLAGPATLQVDLTELPGSDLTPRIFIWDQSGITLSATLSNPATNVTRLQRTFTAGSYYVLVRSEYGGGPYTLEVRSVP